MPERRFVQYDGLWKSSDGREVKLNITAEVDDSPDDDDAFQAMHAAVNGAITLCGRDFQIDEIVDEDDEDLDEEIDPELLGDT